MAKETGFYDSVIKAMKDYDSKENPVLPVGISTVENGCRHIWKTYTGLKECFVYCERCDEKRPCSS